MKSAIAHLLVVTLVAVLSQERVSAAPADAVTHHSLTLNGDVIAYTGRAGTITLYDKKRRPTADIFFTSYVKEGVDAARRPITFFYNGGPGGSSVWQRMAAFGPVRVLASKPGESLSAPYRVVENQYSLLDKTDEVYIDAPATGFSRLLPAGKASDFFGVDQDAAAFAQFITRYLSKYGRWNSPRYLFGESYGTVRSAAIVRLMQGGFGQATQFNGVVLMSTVLNTNLLWDDENVGGNDWPFVLFLPTEAATAWFHDRVPRQQNFAQFLGTVERFALTEYLSTLAQGDSAPASERDDVVHKLHEYIGLSEEFIRNSNLRIAPGRFRSELLRGQGQVVGYMDTRYTGYDPVGNRDEPLWDNSDLAATPAVVSIFNDYVRKQLGYNTDLQYRSLYDVESRWSWKHITDLGGTAVLIQSPNTIVDLSEAMAENPAMRVFAALGYYDMSTPYFEAEYDFTHLHLPQALRANLTIQRYQSGHMIYVDPGSLAELKTDLARWYDARKL